jgi:histidyl-tRNA synthetase
LIYGEKEAKEGIINVKDSETGEQVPVKIDDLYDYLLKQLKGGSCSNGCSGC